MCSFKLDPPRVQILDFAKRQRDEYIGSELELIWFERDPGKKNRMTSHGKSGLKYVFYGHIEFIS